MNRRKGRRGNLSARLQLFIALLLLELENLLLDLLALDGPHLPNEELGLSDVHTKQPSSASAKSQSWRGFPDLFSQSG